MKGDGKLENLAVRLGKTDRVPTGGIDSEPAGRAGSRRGVSRLPSAFGAVTEALQLLVFALRRLQPDIEPESFIKLDVFKIIISDKLRASFQLHEKTQDREPGSVRDRGSGFWLLIATSLWYGGLLSHDGNDRPTVRQNTSHCKSERRLGFFRREMARSRPISLECRPGRFPPEKRARCLSPEGELGDREPRAALRVGG